CFRGEFSATLGTPSVYRAPAYPAALALPCLLTGRDPLNFLPLLNGVCQWMTLLLLCRHPLAPTGKARLAVVLAVGLDPLLLNFSGRAYVEPMLILSIGLVIAAVDRVVRLPTLRNAIVLGLAWGFSLLVKPILILLAVLIVPASFLLSYRAARLHA